MADTPKVLSQSNPLAATLTDSYTVPASTNAVVSTITVANRSATGTSYRISVAPAGAVDALTHYIAYDVSIGGNEAHYLTLGLGLEATDVVRVYATLATLTFTVNGTEIT